jgi:hypothetical protein
VDENSTAEVSLGKEVSISPDTTHRVSVDPSMLKYLCMVTSLIEGRKIAMKELLKMLARIVRQRSMYRTRRIDYVLSYLNKHPP